MITKNDSCDKKTQIQMISLDQLVPDDHILRKIDRYIDFSFIYQNDSLIQNFIDTNEILGIHFLPLDEHMIKYISSKSIKLYYD